MEDETLNDLETVITSRQLDEVMQADILLGDDTRRFLDGDVGRSVVERAKIDYMAGLQDLEACDLASEEGIAKAREAQQRARVARALIKYLAMNIRAGNQAMTEFEAKQQRGE